MADSSNSEIFVYPGQVILSFAFSLFGIHAVELDPSVFQLLSIIAALFFWSAAWRVFSAVIKKILGFDSPRR